MSYDVTGILLAGGKSSRMGKDKALIKYGDETFMDRSLKKLENLFDEVLVVANHMEKYSIEGVKIVKDIYHQKGPMGGIHAALKAARNDWVFVIPCDMPMWEPFLVEEILKHRKDNDIVVPVINGQVEPLFGLYKKTCIPNMEVCLDADIVKVIEVYPMVKTLYLDLEKVFDSVDDYTKSFFNINTPGDLYNMVKVNGLKTGVQMEQALQMLLENTSATEKVEKVHINHCSGRVLAEDINAPRDLPLSPRSMVDGYAISEKDLEGVAHNMILRVTDQVAAGSIPEKELKEGTAQSVMTGAAVPDGTGAVIKREHVKLYDDKIVLQKKFYKGQNIIHAGSDVKMGDRIGSNGERITPAIMSILSFNGISQVPVYSLVKASVISTGSELILPGEPYDSTKTYNSNMYFADSMLLNLGIETVLKGIVPDNAAKISETLGQAMDESDIVISFGGAFTGEYDLIEQSLLMLGAEIIFSGIEVRPGKSFVAARKEGKLFLCLSGSPGSAFNNLQLLIKPVVKKLMGLEEYMPTKFQIRMPEDHINNRKSRKILQGQASVEKGRLMLCILDGQSIFDVLAKTNILVDVPPEVELKKDELVDVFYIKEE